MYTKWNGMDGDGGVGYERAVEFDDAMACAGSAGLIWMLRRSSGDVYVVCVRSGMECT